MKVRPSVKPMCDKCKVIKSTPTTSSVKAESNSAQSGWSRSFLKSAAFCASHIYTLNFRR